MTIVIQWASDVG